MKRLRRWWFWRKRESVMWHPEMGRLLMLSPRDCKQLTEREIRLIYGYLQDKQP